MAKIKIEITVDTNDVEQFTNWILISEILTRLLVRFRFAYSNTIIE